MRNLLFLFVFSSLFFACELSEPVETINVTTIESYARGVVQSSPQGPLESFLFQAGTTENMDNQLLLWTEYRDVFQHQNPNGITYAVVNRGQNALGTPVFSLTFFPYEFVPVPAATSFKDTFFVAGRSFDFGQQAGQVDVSLRVPLSTAIDSFTRSSQSAFLIEPEGSLTITEVEDIDIASVAGESFYGLDVPVTGKLVTAVFEGKLGYFDPVRYDQFNYTIRTYKTPESLDIENGEVKFFVPTS